MVTIEQVRKYTDIYLKQEERFWVDALKDVKIERVKLRLLYRSADNRIARLVMVFTDCDMVIPDISIGSADVIPAHIWERFANAVNNTCRLNGRDLLTGEQALELIANGGVFGGTRAKIESWKG